MSVLLVPAPLFAQAAQDVLAADIAQFQREPDPVHKARDLAKFGNLQVSTAQKQLSMGQDEASLSTLQSYLQEVQQAYAALSASGINAEKRPSGFKELQISLRENIRRIDDLILTLPVDKRPFFREVRSDLVMVQNGLLDALFPRQPKQNKVQP